MKHKRQHPSQLSLYYNDVVHHNYVVSVYTYIGHTEFKNIGIQSVLQSWLFKSLILINDNRGKARNLSLYAQIKMVMYSLLPMARPTIANDNNDIIVKIKSDDFSTELDLFK